MGFRTPRLKDGLDATFGDINVSGQLNATNVSAGTTDTLLSAVNGTEGRRDTVQETNGVAQAGTVVWDGSLGASNAFGALVVVYGTADGAVARFSDVVHVHRNKGVDVINSNNSANPATRTYARAGVDVQKLELTMGSGTYNVSCSAISARGSD